MHPLDHERFTKLRKVVSRQPERFGHPRGQLGARGLVRRSSQDTREMPRADTGCSRERSEAHPAFGQQIGDLLDEGAHGALSFHGCEYPAPGGRSPPAGTAKLGWGNQSDCPHTWFMSTTTARHARNDRIVQLRNQGLKMKKIATEVGVSERHCARVLHERKQTTYSSEKGPGSSLSSSDATATELLDHLQKMVADLATIARTKAGPYDTGGVIRIEISQQMAENTIGELRRRSQQLVPEESRSPRSETDMS